MSSVSVDPAGVAERVAEVRARITELGGRDVELIAVTKTFGVGAINAAIAAGCDGIGENYAQELLGKVREGFAPARVHFIGRIQSNKVRQLLPHVHVWQTVDRSAVVEELGRRRGAESPEILIQVNTTVEPLKGGVAPVDLDDLRSFAESKGLRVVGLMTMGPTSGDPGATEGAFRLLRQLADRHQLRICSMGMSNDFEVAVSYGSTMVRIGSRLFGPRPSN